MDAGLFTYPIVNLLGLAFVGGVTGYYGGKQLLKAVKVKQHILKP